MKKITFLLCMLSLIFAGSLIGCSYTQVNPVIEQLKHPLTPTDQEANNVGAGPKAVALGTSGDFVILSKAGVTNSPTSVITGNIGTSPIARDALTGFSETMNVSGDSSTSAQVTGKLYAANYLLTTPATLTTAVGDMGIAYADAAGRAGPNYTELGAGRLGGVTLYPGLYKWGTDVYIPTDITLEGGPNDVWIFQVAKGITIANGKKIILAGGALAKNIFWQATGVVTIGTTAHFEGIILSSTAITMNTGSTINGRLLAQTAVTLQSNIVTQPASDTAL